MFARLALPKRFLPQILVATVVVSILGVSYASVLMATSNQPKASWTPNPVTVTFPAVIGQGSNTVSLTCSPSATDLHLVATASGNKVSLTAAPSTVASCSSFPTMVKLTAKCLVSAPQCEGSYKGLVRLTQGDYYRDVSDNLKVKIVVTAPAPDFTLSADPSTLSCATGAVATSTITIVSQNGFSGTVKLTSEALPSGISASISPKAVQGTESAKLTVTCSTAGIFNVEIRGKTQDLSHGITIPVTVTGTVQPGFTISAVDTDITCVEGSKPDTKINVRPSGGFTGTVTFGAVSSSTETVTASIDPASASDRTQLNLTCNKPGTATVTVTGTSGSLAPSSITIKITVNSHLGDFTVATSPSTITGTTDTNYPSTITITGTGSFTGTVALTAPSPSQSLICSLSKPSINIQTEGTSETSTLNCNGSAGTYTVTVTAAGQGKTRTATVKYVLGADSNVTSQPSNSTSMLGLDPVIFYSILLVVIVVIAAAGLFLGRNRLPRK